MIKPLILLFFLTLLIPYSATAQLRETRFDAVEALMQTRQKPVVVFIYTSWCTYCKAMEATTFKNKNVVEMLNRDFYFIRLNAEEKRDIRFLNKTFTHKPTGPKTGIHELAKQLGSIDGKISYPAITVLNTDYEITLQYNAYMSAKTFLKALYAVLN